MGAFTPRPDNSFQISEPRVLLRLSIDGVGEVVSSVIARYLFLLFDNIGSSLRPSKLGQDVDFGVPPKEACVSQV